MVSFLVIYDSQNSYSSTQDRPDVYEIVIVVNA